MDTQAAAFSSRRQRARVLAFFKVEVVVRRTRQEERAKISGG